MSYRVLIVLTILAFASFGYEAYRVDMARKELHGACEAAATAALMQLQAGNENDWKSTSTSATNKALEAFKEQQCNFLETRYAVLAKSNKDNTPPGECSIRVDLQPPGRSGYGDVPSVKVFGNVTIHGNFGKEFKLDGFSDGTPSLPPGARINPL